MNVTGPISKLQAMGYQKESALAAPSGLIIPPGSRAALIRCEGMSVRWRDDGVAVTTTDGMLMLVTDEPLLYIGNLGRLQFIETAVSADLNVLFYG